MSSLLDAGLKCTIRSPGTFERSYGCLACIGKALALGMPASIRPCCSRWGFPRDSRQYQLQVLVLQVFTLECTYTAATQDRILQFLMLDTAQGVTEEAADDIEKDVGRTFPGLAK